MSQLGTVWPEFEKSIAIFQISTFKFVRMKMSLGPKFRYLGIF